MLWLLYRYPRAALASNREVEVGTRQNGDRPSCRADASLVRKHPHPVAFKAQIAGRPCTRGPVEIALWDAGLAWTLL
jgi:hypothetical protein